MSAVSLAPRALYEEVAELLRQRIFRRELEPGSWIDEVRIAEEFGISRTPLREALKVLATEGLVTMKVRRGAYVTEVSEQDLREVYHLLSLLESDASGVVAARATDDELRELRAVLVGERHARERVHVDATVVEQVPHDRVGPEAHDTVLGDERLNGVPHRFAPEIAARPIRVVASSGSRLSSTARVIVRVTGRCPVTQFSRVVTALRCSTASTVTRYVSRQ